LATAPGPSAPYGRDGGGSLRWHNVMGPDILVISSLAKGFGVPVAALTGSDASVRHFEAKSETRVHTSPPSIANIHAAQHALAVNRRHGDALRLRLVKLIRHFHRHLTGVGFSVSGGLFPVQTLVPVPGLDAALLRNRLLQFGIQTVLLRGRTGNNPRLSFILTARHTLHDLDYAVGALLQAVRGVRDREYIGRYSRTANDHCFAT
jgi:8-amino-7-oxononanoate synthase